MPILVVVVAVLLPGAELWYDCVLGVDDLERTDGGNGERVADCGCAEWQHGTGISPWRPAPAHKLPGGARAGRGDCCVQGGGQRHSYCASRDQVAREGQLNGQVPDEGRQQLCGRSRSVRARTDVADEKGHSREGAWLPALRGHGHDPDERVSQPEVCHSRHPGLVRAAAPGIDFCDSMYPDSAAGATKFTRFNTKTRKYCNVYRSRSRRNTIEGGEWERVMKRRGKGFGELTRREGSAF